MKPYLFLIKHNAFKAYGGAALNGREWLALRPGSFSPGETRRYPLDMRLDGPQNRSGRGGEEKKIPIILPAGDRNPVVQPRNIVTKVTELPRPSFYSSSPLNVLHIFRCRSRLDFHICNRNVTSQVTSRGTERPR
jgi:hypothetical protein